MKSVIKSLLPEPLKERLRRQAGAITIPARLENLRRAGFFPERIIDGGAYRGNWTRTIHGIFPGAKILMIEPQPQLEGLLQAVCAEIPGCRYRRALLGAAPGRRRRFLLEESNSRILNDAGPQNSPSVEIETETLETIASAEGFESCDLLKLDLQGHELEALAGAGHLFGRTEVIICEVSWLRIGPVPLAEEVWDIFRARGYRLYDVFGFNYRPLDSALWQTDFVFVRQDSTLISDLRWARGQ